MINLLVRSTALALAIISLSSSWLSAQQNAADPPDGRELFTRGWLPADKRSVAGDGLGPMFNDSSCVACHNLGGIGGAGPTSKNITLLTVLGLASTGDPATQLSSADQPALKTQLINLHPDFASSRSIVLHASSTDAAYGSWRNRFQATGSFPRFSAIARARPVRPVRPDRPAPTNSDQPQSPSLSALALGRQRLQAVLREVQPSGAGNIQMEGFVFVFSSRNSTALFGAGLIDAIPTATILAGEKQARGVVSGRAARLKDGRIGRFGWKAQQASLHDFTLAACAVELGLHVPGNAQLGMPHKKQPPARGLDMNQEQCDALVKFVSRLNRPEQRQTLEESASLEKGVAHFKAVGCADCHVPNLGPVSSLYSDLLLHDMGADLAGSGAYGNSLPNTNDESEPLVQDTELRLQAICPDDLGLPIVGALPREWRTPPLWGCGDSAPYLHDGSAKTLEQAIALHGGEGDAARQRFFMLPDDDREKVLAFLKSLVAPAAE